jgi:hypothetical protein
MILGISFLPAADQDHHSKFKSLVRLPWHRMCDNAADFFSQNSPRPLMFPLQGRRSTSFLDFAGNSVFCLLNYGSGWMNWLRLAILGSVCFVGCRTRKDGASSPNADEPCSGYGVKWVLENGNYELLLQLKQLLS